MDLTAHQRHSDAAATYRRLTAELETQQRDADLPQFWRAEVSRARELLTALESEARVIVYLLNRYAKVEDRYYQTLNSSEQAALLQIEVTELVPAACDGRKPTGSAGMQASPSLSEGPDDISQMDLEELERMNAHLAERCAAQARESAVELEEEAIALRHLVATKQPETSALRALFLKYGVIRGVPLNKMSERQCRHVILKGARDMARENLEQSRETRTAADLSTATRRPSQHKQSDRLYVGLGDRRGRFTVQEVSDKLQIKNTAAKKMLQDAVRRGVVVELPNGWYKVRSR
jgi:hypothetical protein